MTSVLKPTIPAEVADAIEYFREKAWKNESIVDLVINSATLNKYAEALRSIPFDTLLAALVNGYERELTEEERAYQEIRKRYAEMRATIRCGDDYSAGYAAGFRRGLVFMRDELRLDIDFDEEAA